MMVGFYTRVFLLSKQSSPWKDWEWIKIEGTWEEILSHAGGTNGHQIGRIVL